MEAISWIVPPVRRSPCGNSRQNSSTVSTGSRSTASAYARIQAREYRPRGQPVRSLFSRPSISSGRMRRCSRDFLDRHTTARSVTTQSGYEHLLRVHVFSSVPTEPEQFPRLRAVFEARRFLLPDKETYRTLRNRNRANDHEIRPAGLRNSECRNQAGSSVLTPACRLSNGRRPVYSSVGTAPPRYAASWVMSN